MKSTLKLFNAHARSIQVSRKSSLYALTSSLTIRKILHCPMVCSTFTRLLEICRLNAFSWSSNSFFLGFLIGRLTSALSGFIPTNPRSSQRMIGTSNLICSSSQIVLSWAFPSYVGDKYNTFLMNDVMNIFFTVCVFFTTVVLFLHLIIRWAGNGTLTAINEKILTFIEKFLKRFKVPAWQAFTGFECFQKNLLQKMYPKVSLRLIHPKHCCLSFLQTIVFQVKQNENKHGLTIFKHLVFVYSLGAYTLFASYGIPSNVLVPLNLKIEEKLIKTGQRETCCGLKLRFIALKILICLSLHNGVQSKQFYSRYL